MHSFEMQNDDLQSGDTMMHVRSVSYLRTLQMTMRPYYRHMAPMWMSHRMMSTFVNWYCYLHPAKSNSVVLLLCIPLFFLFRDSCLLPSYYIILFYVRIYIYVFRYMCVDTSTIISFFPLFLFPHSYHPSILVVSTGIHNAFTFNSRLLLLPTQATPRLKLTNIDQTTNSIN